MPYENSVFCHCFIFHFWNFPTFIIHPNIVKMQFYTHINESSAFEIYKKKTGWSSDVQPHNSKVSREFLDKCCTTATPIQSPSTLVTVLRRSLSSNREQSKDDTRQFITNTSWSRQNSPTLVNYTYIGHIFAFPSRNQLCLRQEYLSQSVFGPLTEASQQSAAVKCLLQAVQPMSTRST